MCGWLAALGGMLAFGSFGVPIKSKVVQSLHIDPLVMQSYKTAMCFLTSWLFVLVRGESYTFTPWGIVSGLSWVPGGVATIYAIKTAGLAIGIGVGSSFIVLMSFGWGIFVFDEHVHNRAQACIAVGCMLLGLCGMAYFSSPTVAHAASHSDNNNTEPQIHIHDAYYQPLRPEDPDFLRPDEDEDIQDVPHVTDYVAMEEMTNRTDVETIHQLRDGNHELQDAEVENLVAAPVEGPTISTSNQYDGDTPVVDNGNSPATVLCCFGRIRVQERILGILAAMIITGIWGGSILVPMHYAPPSNRGLGYLISFAIGAAVVNLSLWVIRYLYLCLYYSSMKEAYQALPSFHLRKMWFYGGLCGLCWSIGNFSSILAVQYLGQGVGYSATQASMLISGLWGIFYFREIEGMKVIIKWYLSAMVTVLGIVMLGYQHHEK
jgi:glucose uptake protein GlcU